MQQYHDKYYLSSCLTVIMNLNLPYFLSSLLACQTKPYLSLSCATIVYHNDSWSIHHQCIMVNGHSSVYISIGLTYHYWKNMRKFAFFQCYHFVFLQLYWIWNIAFKFQFWTYSGVHLTYKQNLYDCKENLSVNIYQIISTQQEASPWGWNIQQGRQDYGRYSLKQLGTQKGRG